MPVPAYPFGCCRANWRNDVSSCSGSVRACGQEYRAVPPRFADSYISVALLVRTASFNRLAFARRNGSRCSERTAPSRTASRCPNRTAPGRFALQEFSESRSAVIWKTLSVKFDALHSRSGPHNGRRLLTCWHCARILGKLSSPQAIPGRTLTFFMTAFGTMVACPSPRACLKNAHVLAALMSQRAVPVTLFETAQCRFNACPSLSGGFRARRSGEARASMTNVKWARLKKFENLCAVTCHGLASNVREMLSQLRNAFCFLCRCAACKWRSRPRTSWWAAPLADPTARCRWTPSTWLGPKWRRVWNRSGVKTSCSSEWLTDRMTFTLPVAHTGYFLDTKNGDERRCVVQARLYRPCSVAREKTLTSVSGLSVTFSYLSYSASYSYSGIKIIRAFFKMKLQFSCHWNDLSTHCAGETSRWPGTGSFAAVVIALVSSHETLMSLRWRVALCESKNARPIGRNATIAVFVVRQRHPARRRLVHDRNPQRREAIEAFQHRGGGGALQTAELGQDCRRVVSRTGADLVAALAGLITRRLWVVREVRDQTSAVRLLECIRILKGSWFGSYVWQYMAVAGYAVIVKSTTGSQPADIFGGEAKRF